MSSLQQRGLYGLATATGEQRARISGRLAREAPPGGYPAAGDWVAFNTPTTPATRRSITCLERRTAFVRKASGSAGGLQVIAANVDVAFLTASLNADLNPRRLERYLTAAWQSGAAPVVLLTKADLCDGPRRRRGRRRGVRGWRAGSRPVVADRRRPGRASPATSTPGRTAVMVGSSGAGKSTLANALLGTEHMATQAIREADARGRHTTSHRELILLPGGGLLLDTPGMRELGLWDSDEGLAATFDDIETLAAGCRFADCGHSNEPGCAVRAALEAGELDAERWRSFQKLRRELAFLESKEDPSLRAAKRREWVQITKSQRAQHKQRGRD